jgi:hypothetical protein
MYFTTLKREIGDHTFTLVAYHWHPRVLYD